MNYSVFGSYLLVLVMLVLIDTVFGSLLFVPVYCCVIKTFVGK